VGNAANNHFERQKQRIEWSCNWWQVLTERHGIFGDYYYIYLCILMNKHSDQEESKWKCQKGSQNNVNDGLYQIKWLHIVDTAMVKWRQWSVNDFWSCVLANNTSDSFSQSQRTSNRHHRQNREQYPPCPIMQMSVNGASTIFGHVSWEITPPTGCSQS